MRTSDYNNVHDMILVWRREFLKEGATVVLLWLTGIAISLNLVVLIARLLAYFGVIEIQ